MLTKPIVTTDTTVRTYTLIVAVNRGVSPWRAVVFPLWLRGYRTRIIKRQGGYMELSLKISMAKLRTFILSLPRSVCVAYE